MFLKETTKYFIDFDHFYQHVYLLSLFLLYLFMCTSHFHKFFCMLCMEFACLVYEFLDC